MSKKTYSFWMIFLIVFLIYFFTIPPTLAPYRDSGEMAIDIWSMSISHQPGYPLYNIVAKFFSFFLPGNFAYKLNLFSAICGALSCAFLFLFMAPIDFFAAFFISLLFAFNFTMHTVSGVSEMYSIHILLVAILIYWFFNKIYENFSAKNLFLFSFLCGLFMGNRMDISLLYPVFLVIIFLKISTYSNKFSLLFKSLVFFVLGFSVYLYLPIRSLSQPFINWSDPSKLDNFINVITRKSYGSTLDLISTNYKLGELFIPNIKEYFYHILKNFNLFLILVLSGFYFLYKNERKKFYILTSIFILTGPFFLFLANMPPNPHALSIVEPYYLVPDVILILVSIFVFKFLKDKYKIFAYSIILISLFLTIYLNYPYSYRAKLSVTLDYSSDVFKNIPPDSIIVAKKDVQLFSLWYFAYVENLRPDLHIVAYGLSGSQWYQNSGINKGIKLVNLNNEGKEKWELFKSLNSKRIFATLDVPLPENLPNIPNGLTVEILPEKNNFPEINIFENYNFEKIKKPYNDFFVSDIASSYAQAIVAMASFYLNSKKKDDRILILLDKALDLDENLADAPLYKGLYYADTGQWNFALVEFQKSVSIYKTLLKKAEEYYSLEDVKQALRRGIAYALLNLGVCYEKLNDKAKSEESYVMALYYNPKLAQAHYNIAVLYWNIDKNRVRKELEETLRINPNHREAAFYLQRLNTTH